MRKLMVGLMVVGLLALVAPAMAQTPGSQDPLGLITSGAVIPYLGAGAASGAGGMSFLEVYAPLADTSFHMFFFDSSCVRTGPSVAHDLTVNDVEVFRVDDIGGVPPSGLITAASTAGAATTLGPLDAPVNVRTLWINTDGFVRVIDPIAVSTADADFWAFFSPLYGTWSPLRTGANFFAPIQDASFNTVIYLVCPNSNIQAHNSSFSSGSGALPEKFFPSIAGFDFDFPFFNSSPFQVAGSTTPLIGRVYDLDEDFLRDIKPTCNCLTVSPVDTIDVVYKTANASGGTYTELEGGTTTGTPAQCSTTVTEVVGTPGVKNSGNPCPLDPNSETTAGDITTATAQFTQTVKAVPGLGPFSFTAYRSITLGGAAGLDVFGRTSNGNRCSLRDSSDPLFDILFPENCDTGAEFAGSNGR